MLRQSISEKEIQYIAEINYNFLLRKLYLNELIVSAKSLDFIHNFACVDPECFGIGGPTFFIRGKRIQIVLKAGHHWTASKTPFKWRFPGGSMMAQHLMPAWHLCDFSRDLDQYC